MNLTAVELKQAIEHRLRNLSPQPNPAGSGCGTIPFGDTLVFGSPSMKRYTFGEHVLDVGVAEGCDYFSTTPPDHTLVIILMKDAEGNTLAQILTVTDNGGTKPVQQTMSIECSVDSKSKFNTMDRALVHLAEKFLLTT